MKRSIAGVSHKLMSFGTLRWLPVPQGHGRNGALGGLRNLRRTVTLPHFHNMQFPSEVNYTPAR